MAERERILILGGTREAARLAADLVADGHNVITSLAGRTKEPPSLAGEVRRGGFGGVGGLAEWLTANRIDRLIDITHPFAEQISRNAVKAAAIAGVPLEVRTRPPWQKQPGDQWREVESLPEAAAIIPSGATVLLALGSQYVSDFYNRRDVRFIVRIVDPPDRPLPFADHLLLIGKPPISWRDEMQVMIRNEITHVVCRNSGGEGAYAKIEAARHLQLPVIILARR